MNEVTTTQPQAVTTKQDGAADTMAMIVQAAANQATDVEKMRELLSMYREERDYNARMAFDSAFAEMQDELPEIEERGEIKLKEGAKNNPKYALFEDINRAVKPILKAHGFGMRFDISDNDKGITVTCILSHKGGHRESTSKTLQKDTSGAKNSTQAEGSAVSYAMRYTARAILNISTRGIDDDGHAAADPLITEQQRKVILSKLDKIGKGADWLCSEVLKGKVENIKQIPASWFDRTCAKIDAPKA